MGTVVSFTTDQAPSCWADALAAACAELHRVDAALSPYRPDSSLSRLRRGELGSGELPAEILEVIARCRFAALATRGWFDPWAMPDGFDPSGLVKGWAIERAAAILRAHGVDSAMINGGGDIACFGAPAGAGSWRIGIRHPWRPEALAAIIECEGGAVATSGTYERGAHLVNPFTGARRAAVASATVLGADLALADALATALALAGPELIPCLSELRGYEAHLIAWDGTEHTTGGVRLAAAHA
jgi:thiamine biosynthesis lipoprotein